jgi:adenine phosphoribosyltransferase
LLLEDVYDGAPTVNSGRYRTTVNEFTDQQPALRAEVLEEVAQRLLKISDFNADKLLVEEDKGAILGGAMCLASGLPLAVARWYTYGFEDLPTEGQSRPIATSIASEYFEGTLYVNGVRPGDRVIVIDDTISTGGTLLALIQAVRGAGAEVSEVLVAVEKPANRGVERVQKETGVEVKSLVRIDVDPQTNRVVVLSS